MESVIEILGNQIKHLQDQLNERNASLSDRASSASALSWRDRAHAAEAEGEKLSTDIHTLRNQNAELREHLEREVHNEDEKSLLLQYKVSHDNALEQLQGVMEDRERLRNEKDEMERCEKEAQDKLSTYREKYAKMKCDNKELQEALEILHDQLIEATLDKDAALKVAENKHTALVVAQARSHPSDENIRHLLDRLKAGKTTTVTNQPEFAAIKSHSNKAEFKLPEELQTLCSSDGALYLHGAEVMWHGTDIAQAVAVTPMFQFNPKLNGGNGGWQKIHVSMRVGEKRDLFHKDGSSWFYMGTYECVNAGTVTYSSLDKLHGWKFIHNRTVLFPDLVPPFMNKLVPSMYEVGALKVGCMGLSRVGYNMALYESLFANKNAAKYFKALPAPKQGKLTLKRQSSGSQTQSDKRRKL